MEKILFVTQTLGHKMACGIGLIGKLIGDMLVKSERHSFEIIYTDSMYELKVRIRTCQPSIIIYNYHPTTTKWLHDVDLKKRYSNIDHVMLHHDITQKIIDAYPAEHNDFQYLVTADPTLAGNNNVFIVNRLMPSYTPAQYVEDVIPSIGFQGFGFRHKGIHRIAELVNKEFDEAIIRLHIPYSFYGDSNGAEARTRVGEVRSIITKPGIRIEVSHNMLSTNQVIDFLARNTINCYLYDYLDGAGLASSPDYALAANRPIAVTKSHQLRNYLGTTPSICVEDNSLKDIISFGLEPLKDMRKNYSEANVLNDYENMIDAIVSNRSKKSF